MSHVQLPQLARGHVRGRNARLGKASPCAGTAVERARSKWEHCGDNAGPSAACAWSGLCCEVATRTACRRTSSKRPPTAAGTASDAEQNIITEEMVKEEENLQALAEKETSTVSCTFLLVVLRDCASLC